MSLSEDNSKPFSANDVVQATLKTFSGCSEAMRDQSIPAVYRAILAAFALFLLTLPILAWRSAPQWGYASALAGFLICAIILSIASHRRTQASPLGN